MSDIEVTVVPRELYYHEVAYVRGLEARNAELVAALAWARPFVEVFTVGQGHPQQSNIDGLARIDAALAAAGHKP